MGGTHASEQNLGGYAVRIISVRWVAPLNIQILNLERVTLDELPPGLDRIPH